LATKGAVKKRTPADEQTHWHVDQAQLQGGEFMAVKTTAKKFKGIRRESRPGFSFGRNIRRAAE
jgi:hypothetical protein